MLSLHPAGNSACTPLISEHHLTWMVGAPLEDTISVMQLVTRGIPTRYPHLRILNSHLGGALPMLLQRADNQYRWEAPDPPEAPSVAARRMWYDSVGHGHVPALRCAIESFGADRLVLGTDFPYEAGDVFVWAIDYIRDPQIDPTRTPSSTAMRWRCSRWRTAGAPRPPRDSATLGRDPPSTAQLLDGRPTRYLATISDYSGQGSVK